MFKLGKNNMPTAIQSDIAEFVSNIDNLDCIDMLDIGTIRPEWVTFMQTSGVSPQSLAREFAYGLNEKFKGEAFSYKSGTLDEAGNFILCIAGPRHTVTLSGKTWGESGHLGRKMQFTCTGMQTDKSKEIGCCCLW